MFKDTRNLPSALSLMPTVSSAMWDDGIILSDVRQRAVQSDIIVCVFRAPSGLDSSAASFFIASEALLSAVPVPDPRAEDIRKRVILEGDLPSPSNPPPGCVFNTRCPIAEQKCSSEVPEWREISTDHWVACHFAE